MNLSTEYATPRGLAAGLLNLARTIQSVARVNSDQISLGSAYEKTVFLFHRGKEPFEAPQTCFCIDYEVVFETIAIRNIPVERYRRIRANGMIGVKGDQQ